MPQERSGPAPVLQSGKLWKEVCKKMKSGTGIAMNARAEGTTRRAISAQECPITLCSFSAGDAWQPTRHIIAKPLYQAALAVSQTIKNQSENQAVTTHRRQHTTPHADAGHNQRAYDPTASPYGVNCFNHAEKSSQLQK